MKFVPIQASNPKYILRNHILETAIRDTERGGTQHLEELLTCLRDPFREQPGMEHLAQADNDGLARQDGVRQLS